MLKICFSFFQGRQALEWVIDKLEVSDFANSAVKSTDELITRAGKQLDDFTEKMQSAANKTFDEIHILTTPTSSQSMPKL